MSFDRLYLSSMIDRLTHLCPEETMKLTSLNKTIYNDSYAKSIRNIRKRECMRKRLEKNISDITVYDLGYVSLKKHFILRHSNTFPGRLVITLIEGHNKSHLRVGGFYGIDYKENPIEVFDLYMTMRKYYLEKGYRFTII
jgi:hypothetical protein